VATADREEVRIGGTVLGNLGVVGDDKLAEDAAWGCTGHRGELTEDGGHPGGCADLISDHFENLFVVILNEVGGDHVLDAVLLNLLGSSPDVVDVVDTGDADRHAARVDKHVHLDFAEEGHPILPLDACRLACEVDWTRSRAAGDKGDAATARTAGRLSGEPIVFVVL